MMLTGLLLLVLTGLSWVAVGAVVGKTAKFGIPLEVVQLFSALVMAAASVFVLLVHPDQACSWTIRFLVMLSLALSGALNYVMLLLMGKAMKTGPNGIVWATIQSGLGLPFLFGIVVFREALTLPRLSGLVLIIGSLLLFGTGQKKSQTANDTKGSWRKPAWLAFFCAGSNQILSNLPSYFPEALPVSSYTRTLGLQLGIIIAFLLLDNKLLNSSVLRDRRMWRFALLLAATSVLSAFFLVYNGMNLVTAAGAGAIAYPVMVGSCIVSFTLYSRLFLREKLTPPQWGGLVVGCFGIVLISL